MVYSVVYTYIVYIYIRFLTHLNRFVLVHFLMKILLKTFVFVSVISDIQEILKVKTR